MKFKITCPCGCYFVIDGTFKTTNHAVHCPNCDETINVNAMIDLKEALRLIASVEEKLERINENYSLQLLE